MIRIAPQTQTSILPAYSVISHHTPQKTDYDLDQISTKLPDSLQLAFDSIIIKV